MKITKTGSYLKTDSGGYFLNDLSGVIKKPWKEAVEVLVEECKVFLKGKLHSIYIRGSVATGKAVEYVSDIDCIVVVKDDPKNLDLNFLSQTKKKILDNYRFITKVETMFVDSDRLLDRKQSFNTGFLIKTQSLCVYGNNLQSKLSMYKPDKELALNLHGRWIEKNIEWAKERIKGSQSESETKKWCAWVAKRIVRAGFALTIDKEKKYTRDIYLCYRDFFKYYPQQKKEMLRVLELAMQPITNKEEILALLDSFGVWLRSENRKVFGKLNDKD